MLRTALFVVSILCSTLAFAQDAKLATATFAGGCFWCVEEAFDKLPGVISTASGFMGGHKKHPTYDEVTRGATGHTESVQVVYDPAKVSYDQLLDHFWVNHDPTVTDRQFCDSGPWYRPVIFFHTDEQKRLAEASKAKWEKQKPFKQPLLTPITPKTEFWPAEDYHQNYFNENGGQPYCRAMIGPKIEKLRKVFAEKLR